MALVDQLVLANDPVFQTRVEAALVHAAIAVQNEVVDDVQTITVSGNPTGGTFTLGVNNTTVVVPWNCTDLQLQALLNTALGGAGNCQVTGSGLPAGSLVVEFMGNFGNRPIDPMVVTINNLTGGSSPAPAVAHTTTGVYTANHARRAALASRILQSPVQSAVQLAISVTDNPTVMADYITGGHVQSAVLDNDIQFQVNAMFNAES